MFYAHLYQIGGERKALERGQPDNGRGHRREEVVAQINVLD